MLEGVNNLVYLVAFSHHDKHLASASMERTIKIWDTTSSKCLQTLKNINAVAFSLDDEHLALALGDETIKTWIRLRANTSRRSKAMASIDYLAKKCAFLSFWNT